MKKCDYCAKEVSLNEYYCSEDCEKHAIDYYTVVKDKEKIFSVINVISFFSICASLIWTMFQPYVGLYILSGVLLVVSILFYIYPFATGLMLEKYKVKKSVSIIKKIAIAILVLSIIITIVTTFVFYVK